MPKNTSGSGQKQDTPGRPSSSSSRQQTHPNQGTQTGAPEIDRKSGDSVPREDMRKRGEATYHDRPTDDGMHGDGDQAPNPRPS